MASFDDHISQAKSNFRFLEITNANSNNHVDWQVTICYYTALHIIDAHLAKFGLHYQSHRDVAHAINFSNTTSVSKLPEGVCLAYKKLETLSRRSRYLCHDDAANRASQGHRTFKTTHKHLAKAIRQVDKIMIDLGAKYSIEFDSIIFFCPELGLVHSLKHFKSAAVNPVTSNLDDSNSDDIQNQ